MQGLKDFIPTEVKVRYLNQLLKVGFHTLDFGSFVSPKAIPQMRDTAEVLQQLDPDSPTRLLAIVANLRGARDACTHERISYLGYPFSISETFQIRNTNATIEESLERVELIQELCLESGKELVIYISMGFGNPYGDPWNYEIVQYWIQRLSALQIRIFQLSDTIGVSTPENISYLFEQLLPRFPKLEIGAHLHTTPHSWREKMEAAWNSGCRRFDGAIRGYGGCPMAKDELTGNMPTENMIAFFEEKNISTHLDMEAFRQAINMAAEIFPTH